MTIREVARMLGVPDKKVSRWAHDGTIPARLVNGRYQFHRSEVMEWAADQHLPVAGSPLPSSPAGASGAWSLSQALATGGVHYEVGGGSTDPASILQALLAPLPLPSDERELLLNLMTAGGGFSSTAIGHGIAIPHVRRPIIQELPEPLLSLSFLAAPIDAEAPDGRPVHAVFLVVTPSVPVHLEVLATLALALQDPGVLAALDRRAPAETIVAEIRRSEGGNNRPASSPSPS